MSESEKQRLSTTKTTISRRLVPRSVIETTLRELRSRSAGWRESAAIWAGNRDGTVKQVLFHHQLADDRGGPLSLELPETAKFDLYRKLASEDQILLALLHTHPAAWVGLSAIDQQNQLSSRVGFWSIVLPHYGRCTWNKREIGFHVRGERGWTTLRTEEVGQCMSILEL